MNKKMSKSHPPSSPKGAAWRQKQVGESELGREVKQKCLQAALLQEETAGTTMLRVKAGSNYTWEYKALWVRQ